MRLEEFVRTSLLAIVEGVSSAQATIAGNAENGEISPPIKSNTGTISDNAIAISDRGLPVHTIEFDVSVSASEGAGTKGGIGIFVGAITLGSQGASDKSRSQDSRIRFSVPITFPTSKRS